MDCFGGAKLAPIAGYWRALNTSLTVFPCYLQDACEGSADPNIDEELYNPLGNCKPGYAGKLCSMCNVGFSRNSKFQC